ncbi:hypothetical protein ABZ345_09805 [Lentzea sp. NPDC005914]|uniref:hypothetical protein n=1 Tax=Lentzea sp. NPDC005914 TaxID=3154572 RepID=UPI0033CB130B
MKTVAAHDLVSVTVQLTVAEAIALSFVAVAVTSAVDDRVVNAADRGLHKLREAAATHVR